MSSSMDHSNQSEERRTSDFENEADENYQYKKWSKNAFGKNVKPAGGSFTDEESAIVKAAVAEYCSNKQITISSFCSEMDHRRHHKGAWVEIATKIPTRSVVSVYRHGLRILHPFKRGEWTDEEENTLIEYVTKYGKKWSVLQKKLNRSADSVRDKYREISTEYVKGKWTDDDWEKLLQCIRDFLKVDKDTSLEDIGKRIEGQEIVLPWNALSKKMVNRSRLSCSRKWKAMIKKYTSGSSESEPSSDSSSSHENPKRTKQKKRKKAVGSIEDTEDDSSVSDSKLIQPTRTKKKHLKTSRPNKVSSSKSLAHSNNAIEGGDEPWSFDQALLQRLASSSYTKVGSVPWASIHYPLGNAMDRWNVLCDEFFALLDDPNLEDEISDKPIYELAGLILEKKVTNQSEEKKVSESDDEDEEDAKIAARTVEALGLPSL